MKPAAFEYLAPRSREEVVSLLGEHGEDCKILAGGQSLVPAMNFRLTRPALLVDINRAADLDYLHAADGRLSIGALTRHARFERPVAEGPLGRLLPLVARHIAHAPIRTRGTFTGSLAHADPASEWCATVLALDAELVAESRSGGARTIRAGDFFRTIFSTELKPDELLVEAQLPLLDASWRCGFQEFSRRAGDFGLAIAIAAIRLDGGTIREARIALGGIASTPVLASDAAAALVGSPLDGATIAEAAERAAAEVDPTEDIHASAEYRRDLVRAMTARALRQAAL